jgi:hypothetical protein
MHDIEKELIKITGYKARKKFANRQEYLRSILNDVSKLDNDQFDELTDEAAVWTNKAVEALNARPEEEIPDFDEIEAVDDSEDDNDQDHDDPEVEEDSETEGEADDDPDEEDADEDDAEAQDEDEEVVTDDSDEEDEPAPKKAKNKVPPKKSTLKKIKQSHKRAPRTSPNDPDVVLDKWGCMEGSKNARALAMFEKGATTREVKDAIGGTYYNILKKAEQQGHRLEKDGSIIKLTHRDDLAKKAPAKVPAKKAKK